MKILKVIFRKTGYHHDRKIHFLLAAVFMLIGMVIALVILATAFYLVRNRVPEGQPQEWGITYSKKYAAELGLPWREAYLAALDELNVRSLRLPVYWDEIEPSPDTYDFATLDWMLSEAQYRGAKVLLAVGQRLPRWPECHIPRWLVNGDDAVRERALLNYLNAAISRYRNNPAVTAWQIENEPFLGTFGICPPPNAELLKKEVDLVRALDPTRPIIITESGELSSWITAAPFADIVGVSLYRTVWNPYFGFFHWPLPSWYYRKKAELILNQKVKNVIITEVQLEPWVQAPLMTVPIEEQVKIFKPRQFKSTVAFAENTGLSEIYLWGMEWWYYMKLRGNSAYWDQAVKTFSD